MTYEWTLTVGDLRSALAALPDETPVVLAVPGGFQVHAGIEEALYRPNLSMHNDLVEIRPEINPAQP